MSSNSTPTERVHRNCPMCRCEQAAPNKLEKRCADCKQVKLITEFYNDRTRHDGLAARCKPCHKTSVAEYARRRRGRNREINMAKREKNE